MGDLGEWDKTEYEFQRRKTLNQIEKEEIQIARWDCETREIYLKISDLKLSTDKAQERIDKMKKEIDWINEKKGELE